MSSIIYMTIDEKETFAWVTEIPHRNHRMFKVLFENDYENIFYTDVQTGLWIEEDLGVTEFAQAVGKEIRSFCKNPYHVPKILTWHRQEINGKVVSFGFFSFMKDKYKMYEIYNTSMKYMYTLVAMDNDEWQILGNNSLLLKNIDGEFIDHVIQVLPLYSEKAR